MASALVVVGAVAFATPAYAQGTTQPVPGSSITSTASCNSPLGTGVQITWTLANDSNVPETGSVTTVTGGNGTLNATTYAIPPSSGQPAQTATLTQTLPAGTTGVITLEVSSTWADAHSQIDSGTFNLSTTNCAAPQQTIAGHIYLCNEGNPTTTEETGGTLAASGTDLSTIPPASNPSAPTDVTAGTYTMTATDPPGFHLVSCGGSSSPNGAGTSATESVSVPSGGAGEGLFYAASDVNSGTSSGVSSGASSGVNPAPTSPSTPITQTGGATASPVSGLPVSQLPQGTATGGVTLKSPFVATDPSTGLWNTPCSDTSTALWSSGCTQKPSIKLKKSASIGSFSAPGTLVTYSYKVTNTGNVTLDPVVVSDPMTGLSDISCPDTSLGPWGTETCTATYTTTQSDVDHGSISNTGTATGTAPNGKKVTDTSSVCIPACQKPSIKLKKSASIGSFSAPGTLVTYSYKVTNTGNVTLDPVVVSDPMTGLSDISCPDTSLGPWGTETCTATYTTTQSDVDHGSICEHGHRHGHRRRMGRRSRTRPRCASRRARSRPSSSRSRPASARSRLRARSSPTPTR